MSVAATAKDNRIIFDPRMGGPVMGSVVFHILVIFLLMVGIPYIREDVPVAETPLSVELVSEEQADQIVKKSEKIVKERPPMNDQPPPLAPPKMPRVAAKEPPKPLAPAPPDDAEDLAPPKEKDKPAPPVAKPVKPAARKPPPPKKEEKVSEEEQEQEFKSVLKNLLPDEEVQDKVEKNASAQASPLSSFSQIMSMGELDALRAQLSQCWKLMSGARYAENLIVDIKLFMNPDRTVRDAQIVDLLRYNSDSYYRAAADSALRAVRNPHCNPLDLPPQKYDLWKVMTVSFDPREML